MQLPIDDKHSYNKEYLEAQLAILMAGRIAEEIFMHHITTGAGNDIEAGVMSFGKKEEQIFLGREIAQHRDYSEVTAIRSTSRSANWWSRAMAEPAKSSRSESEGLVRIAEAMLEGEVLEGAEVRMLIDGGVLPAIPRRGRRAILSRTSLRFAPRAATASGSARRGTTATGVIVPPFSCLSVRR
jgi:cell division protease FtsH